jgi:two-component system sensor histidine kinase AtoS
MNESGDTGQKLSGLGFENALRTCLLSGVILVESKAGIATVNQEARQILGLAADQTSEMPIDALPEAIRDVAHKVLMSGKPSSARQIAIPTNPGAGFAHVAALPLRSISANPCVVLTLLSINSTTPFLQQIRQLDRLANTGTLAAGMAHEIKNALVAGRTFLDLLLEKNSDAELVQIVRRETGRIDAIVSQMLRFSSTTAVSLKPVRLHEVLDHALRLVQPQVDRKSISLERVFESNADTITGDEYELQQAFVNLVLNALEAMSERARLTIRTGVSSTRSEGPRKLKVVVQDTGAGILPEHMERLFEPFFTTKDSGTGLGLAITRRIIEEHGGSISVASAHGEGTTFTVLLPLLPESDRSQLGGSASAMLGKQSS